MIIILFLILLIEDIKFFVDINYYTYRDTFVEYSTNFIAIYFYILFVVLVAPTPIRLHNIQTSNSIIK